MGVKLQLLLGLFLFGSVCRSEDNTTNFANVSSEKLDSTRNLIEKLPKTDTQINLVNKDTQDSADVSQKYSKYPIGTDVHKNKTFSEENESNENNNKGRQDNSRSIDVEKLHSPDFHNNDYSSDNLKFLENTIRKASTKGYLDFSNFQLTTPKNSYFDAKFEEAKQKLEQEYEENTPEHFDDHHIEEGIDMDHHEHHLDDDVHIDTLFGDSNLKPNASIDYKEKTRISRNNTFDDNSEHNQFSVEKVQKLNFASEYNVTTSDEDESSRTEPDPEKPETTSSRGFLTSRKPVTLTKPPTSPSNHILSNKIESETIKAINSLTTEYPTTKRLKEKNEIVKEQSVEENKIIPIEITEPETTEQLTTENVEKVTNAATPIEQIKETTIYYEVPVETLTTREHEEQTTSNNEVQFSEETTFKINDDTTYRNDETTKINEILTTTESYFEATESSTVTSTTDQTTQQVTDEQTTYLPLDSTTTIGLDGTTTIVSKDDTTVATTDASKTEATTVALINETKQQTTIEEFADSTTESLIRISKSFSFEDRPTTTDQTETATETINIKLFSTKAIDEGRTTDKIPVVQNATEIDTTTTMTTEVKTEIETSATSTTTEGTVTTLDYKQTKSNITHTTWLPETTAELNDTTSLPETNSSMPSTIDGTKFRNASATSEECTTYSASSTEEYTSDSSPGPDTGNIGGQEDNKGKIAAIVISTVGAVSLILLAGLLYIMRKRQKRFNYKQRCRPVSLDHYSVDNVSGFNSTRRKHERQSKRSYGNPAFDDPVAVTHPLNFPALAKFATNTEDIKAEFEEIPQITAKINELPEGCEIKNRYANVIPLPETRVFLQPIDGYPTSDYINANYVTGPKNTKGYYIACQGPMQNTVDDFWRMVWEQQTKVILMVTHLFENGVEKCVDYLPPSEVLDCNRLFGDFQVTLKKRDVKDKYIISNLQLKNMVSNSWREITHFWYLGWPEKGVPTEENSLIAFLIEARSYMKSSTLDKTAAANGNTNGPPKNEINPVVVHCSPGTGRTGVVIACDIAIREFEQTRLVDIPKIIYRIRRDRASAVQTKEQYMFIYKVVSLYATKLTGGALESF